MEPLETVVEDLSDILTVVMCCLEQLARQPLTQTAQRQVARANAATSRFGPLLWQLVDARSNGSIILPHLEKQS